MLIRSYRDFELPETGEAQQKGTSKKSLKKFSALGVAIDEFPSTSAMAADITGAGSTFVFPVVAKWAAVYKGVRATA